MRCRPMSEHTPLTEAEENVVEFVRTFETGEAAANALPIMFRAMNAARTSTATAAEFCEHGFRPEPGRCPAGCTEATHTRFGEPSTATADTGLRERAGLGRLITGLLEEHWPNSGVNGWYLTDLILDATAAPTTDAGARD